MKKITAICMLLILATPFHAQADIGALFGVYNKVQGKFEKAYFSMTDKMLIGCGNNQKCRDDVSHFLKFVWDNKDKRNMKLVVAKCVVKTATKKGILIRLSMCI
jgi:lipopolysaccharide biosynthesis regulator YciM